MEYPGTRFVHPVRVTLLILVIAAFFIISPVLILYTAGYRYDWQNGFLKETGAISIDIQPKTISIYLNGIKLKDKMPVRLNNIAPAKYFLKMTAPGYFDWTKYIEVKNKQTTYIKEISLLKKNKPQILIKGGVDNIALSNDNNYILYTVKNNNAKEIWLWNIKDQKSRFVQRIESKDKLNIVWSQGNYAAVSSPKSPYSTLLIVDTQDPLRQTDLTKFTTSTIEKFNWEDLSDQLYFSTKNNIYSFSPDTQETNVIAKNTYSDWYMANDQLWTLHFNTTTKKYDIFRDTLGFKSSFSSFDSPKQEDGTNQKEWELLKIYQNTVLLKNKTQPEMVLLTGNKQFNLSGDKFLISKYNNWWLIWTQWELWTYSQGEDPYLLNRSGEHLNNVFPLDIYNTLGLVWQDKATALYPYYLVTHDLSNEKIEASAADSDNKILYFITKIGDQNGVWKLEY